MNVMKKYGSEFFEYVYPSKESDTFKEIQFYRKNVNALPIDEQ